MYDFFWLCLLVKRHKQRKVKYYFVFYSKVLNVTNELVPPDDSRWWWAGTLGGSCLIHIKSLLLEACAVQCGRGGRGIGNVPPGFMESAMGNPGQEELWAEKEEEESSGIQNMRKKSPRWSGFGKSWDDPNFSEGMRRKYHIWEVTVVSASGRKNHLDSPLSYSHFPLHSSAAQQFSKSQIQIQTQAQRQMQGKIQRQTQRHLKYSHLPWHSAEQFSAAQVLHNPLYSWDVRAASPSSVLKS